MNKSIKHFESLFKTMSSKTIYFVKENRDDRVVYIRTLVSNPKATKKELEDEIYGKNNRTHNVIFDSEMKKVFIDNSNSSEWAIDADGKEMADLEKKITGYKHFVK